MTPATTGSTSGTSSAVGQPGADGFVEIEIAGLDQLHHHRSRDDLGDAGDPESVVRLGRLARRPAAGLGVERPWRPTEAPSRQPLVVAVGGWHDRHPHAVGGGVEQRCRCDASANEAL